MLTSRTRNLSEVGRQGWAFLGDGEPTTRSARRNHAAARESSTPDFVVKLQSAAARRSGARNGQIIQELEAAFASPAGTFVKAILGP